MKISKKERRNQMENNNEITSLINSFKQYRDLLTPIEESLREFSVSYENISDEIKKLNTAFLEYLHQKQYLIF